mmetsp:Transcript_20997/g.43616  ORF Transcript_20997/g.43616 Transcript_20997/m.43616 type:complete len:278 (+) Transcript_20997:173-1006(+)
MLPSEVSDHGLHSLLNILQGVVGLGVEVPKRNTSTLWLLSREGVFTHELLHTVSAPLNHALFSLTDPHTGIIKLFVGSIGSLRVSNLSLEVVTVLGLKFTKTVPVSPLSVGINVHLHNTSFNSGFDLLVSGTRSSMHDKENRFGTVSTKLLLCVLLVLKKTLRRKLNISGLVNTVDVSKGSGDGEHTSDRSKGFVYVPNLLRTGVKLFGVNIFIVHSILLASSNSNLHLEPHFHGCHPFEVLNADSDVLFIWLLGKIKHVGREKRLAVLSEIGLIGL